MFSSVTKKRWDSKLQIEGVDDSYTTLSGIIEEYSADVDMESGGYEAAQVFVEIDYDVTPTDEVLISLYGSLDGEIFDNSPIWTISGDKTIDPQRLSFIVEDLAHFRLGFKQTGSSDSHNVRAYARPWRYTKH